MFGRGDDVGGYRIEEVGEPSGGVFRCRATQVSLDRPVQLEIVRGSSRATSNQVRRYAEIEHPNLEPVLDTGEVDAAVYRVTAAHEVRTLAAAMAAGDVDPEGGRRVLSQVADGLERLHAAGLVHGDVRPATIVVDASLRARLQPPLLHGDDDGSTADALDPDQLRHAAPEVLRGEEPTSASDRWALAACAFEVEVGEPLHGSAEAAIEAAGTPGPSSGLRRDGVSDDLHAALQGPLAADPAKRPERATAVVDALPASVATAPQSAGSRPAALIGGVAAVALLVIVAIVATRDTGSDVALPTVPQGALPLGSDLLGGDAGIELLDCDGATPSESSPECSIMQTSLPGADLIAPEDGSITGWTVRGATGTVRLQVLRLRDGGFRQVYLGQLRDVPDTGVHHFEESLEIYQGDAVSIYVVDGGVGVRRGVDGAETGRWIPARQGGPSSPPDLPPGSGFDHEVLFRVDYLPGVPRVGPEQYDGSAAVDLPEGEVIETQEVVIGEDLTVDVSWVALDDRLWLDLAVDGVRTSRVEAPGIDLAGEPVSLDSYSYGDGESGEAAVIWQNPGEKHPVERYLLIDRRTWFFIN